MFFCVVLFFVFFVFYFIKISKFALPGVMLMYERTSKDRKEKSQISDYQISDTVKSQVRLFADDCLLYRQIKSQTDHSILQNDLIELEKWAAKWGMRFNAKKCYILSIRQKSSRFYQLDGEILQEVNSSPYLGITISNDMQWKTHITSIVKKANSTLGFLRRNLKYCPEECKRLSYIALVRSTLEYGAIVWDPYKLQEFQSIEKIQRQAA